MGTPQIDAYAAAPGHLRGERWVGEMMEFGSRVAIEGVDQNLEDLLEGLVIVPVVSVQGISCLTHHNQNNTRGDPEQTGYFNAHHAPLTHHF
jgi:hypothetical protein